MAGVLLSLVMIPRFSTYLGPQFYYGFALDVTAFDALTLSMWSGPQPGGATNVSLVIEGSVDRTSWIGVNTAWGLLPGVETQQSLDLTVPWIRSFLSVQGPNSAVTCWAQGSLSKRER